VRQNLPRIAWIIVIFHDSIGTMRRLDQGNSLLAVHPRRRVGDQRLGAQRHDSETAPTNVVLPAPNPPEMTIFVEAAPHPSECS
jgi:hypothetical protein